MVCIPRQYVDEQQSHEQPLYIFSESYGGKVCADFALHLLKAQKEGRINVNLRWGLAYEQHLLSAPFSFALHSTTQ